MKTRKILILITFSVLFLNSCKKEKKLDKLINLEKHTLAKTIQESNENLFITKEILEKLIENYKNKEKFLVFKTLFIKRLNQFRISNSTRWDTIHRHCEKSKEFNIVGKFNGVSDRERVNNRERIIYSLGNTGIFEFELINKPTSIKKRYIKSIEVINKKEPTDSTLHINVITDVKIQGQNYPKTSKLVVKNPKKEINLKIGDIIDMHVDSGSSNYCESVKAKKILEEIKNSKILQELIKKDIKEEEKEDFLKTAITSIKFHHCSAEIK